MHTYEHSKHYMGTIDSAKEHNTYIMFVVVLHLDIAGGDKIPRKGGPGITQSDLLVVNKTDLADAVGADLKV